jgi:hypothetical protein
MRKADSDTMYQSGSADGRVTRRQPSDRHADMIAIVSRMVPQSKPLKGLRKLSQLVEMPGFLMYTAVLSEHSKAAVSSGDVAPSGRNGRWYTSALTSFQPHCGSGCTQPLREMVTR